MSADEPAWYMKYGARGVGSIGGVVAMILGVIGALSTDTSCILAGIWQIFAGFIVVSAEAPCCCMFIDFVDRYSKWVEARPHWQKALLYVGVSLPPLFMCFLSLSIIFGSGFLFITGVLYGMMAIGKKGGGAQMPGGASSGAAYSQSALVDDPEAWRSN